MHFRRSSFAGACCLLLLAAPSGWSQVSSLQVSVQDPSGAVIENATVQAADQTAATNDRGVARLDGLTPGRRNLRVEANGFAAKELRNVNVRPGVNRIDVKLELPRLSAEVSVKPEDSLPAFSGFGSILTPQQIAQLPDDPDELEAMIQELAGPGGSIRVNGFRGGRLPPKSQIREIRIRTNPYSAENHESGFMGVDIFTKPGLPDWHGSVTLGFRDEALGARNSFAPFRAPEQRRRFGASINGPLRPNRTSFFLNAEGTLNYDSRTILATLPNGLFNALALRPTRQLDVSARIEDALTESHSFRLEYQRNAISQRNQGVGDFDLPERAYSSDQTEHVFRLSDSGLITTKLVNEVRFQSRWQENVVIPSRAAGPSISVFGAFNSGPSPIERNRRVHDFEVADNLDFATRKHAMKAGILFEGGRYRSRERQNFAGTFVFASLGRYLSGQPTTYTRRTGEPSIAFSQFQSGLYFQDEWRARRNLSVSMGVRWEQQTQLTDRDNIAPRLGLAWSPFRRAKTTVRAGAGLFYDWAASTTVEQALRVNGTRQADIVIRDPGFPDPLSGGARIELPSSRMVRDPNLSQPYIAQFSIGIEQPLGSKLQVRSDVIRQRGSHLLRSRDVNSPFGSAGRPSPTEGNIVQIESSGRSQSTELRMQIMRQLPAKLHWMVNYSVAKSSNDTDSPFSLPASNYDLRGEWGPAIMDIRHRIFGMWSWQTAGGIQIGSTFRINSAPPYNVTTGFDNNGDTISNDRPAGVSRNSARGTWQWDYGSRLSWTFGFGKPAPQPGGPQVRILRAGDENVLGSLRPADIQKRWKVELFVQSMNLFNHANRMNYVGVQTSPFFGKPLASQAARRIESGLRVSF